MPGGPRKSRRPNEAAKEVELKFLLDSEGMALLRKLPVIGRAIGKAKPTRLTATYFDMPDRRLEKAGLTMRLRSDGKERILTIKNMAKASIGRGEWERPIAHDSPQAPDWTGSPAASVLADFDAALATLFTSTVERSIANVTHGTSRIEIACDAGRIERNGEALPICEVELELKQGKKS